MNRNIKKIAVLGPESSGKTELCIALASRFNTCYVKEFARSFLPSLSRPYTADDLLYITSKQLESEREALLVANEILFCDTELINLKQWHLHKFGQPPGIFETELNKKPYHFYLLTAPDLPWIFDPLRENPDKGDYFFEIYRKEIEHYGFPYAVVCGKGRFRADSAIRAVNQFSQAG